MDTDLRQPPFGRRDMFCQSGYGSRVLKQPNSVRPLRAMAILLLVLTIPLLTACEALVGEAGEGLAGEEAAEAGVAARAGAAEGALARSPSVAVEPEVATAIAPTDVVEPPVEELTAQRGVADAAVRRAGLNFGSEPLEGWARHFDEHGIYRGYSYFTETEVRHYDELGNFEGKEIRTSDGSKVYNASLEYKGKTVSQGTRTLAYDEHGKYKGFSERIGNQINGYDDQNKFTGHSIIRPLPNGFNLPPIPLVGGSTHKRDHLLITSFRLFIASDVVPPPEERRFTSVVRWNEPGVMYLQIDGTIPGGASEDFDVPYSYWITGEGPALLHGSFTQHIRRSWQSATYTERLFKMDAGDANQTVFINLYSGPKRVARTSLKVLP
jgi:hypothetical protein